MNRIKSMTRETIINIVRAEMEKREVTFAKYYADKRIKGVDGYGMKWFNIQGHKPQELADAINNRLPVGYVAVLATAGYNKHGTSLSIIPTN